jgi:hypothetical protein
MVLGGSEEAAAFGSERVGAGARGGGCLEEAATGHSGEEVVRVAGGAVVPKVLCDAGGRRGAGGGVVQDADLEEA